MRAILEPGKSALPFLMDISSVGSGVGDVLIHEIERDFCKFVQVVDIQETYASPSDDNCDAEPSEELEPYRPKLVVNRLKKPATVASAEEDDTLTAMGFLFSEEPISPISLLVSALKGTREKLGASAGEMSVKWAPDVYDPIPNSLSHTVKGKQKKHRREKECKKRSGKKGQKSNLRGGAVGGKEKKQVRKAGGKCERSYKTLNSCDRLVESSCGLNEFDVGSPDYCGTSFLKKSPTKLHYTVAQAL